MTTRANRRATGRTRAGGAGTAQTTGSFPSGRPYPTGAPQPHRRRVRTQYGHEGTGSWREALCRPSEATERPYRGHTPLQANPTPTACPAAALSCDNPGTHAHHPKGRPNARTIPRTAEPSPVAAVVDLGRLREGAGAQGKPRENRSPCARGCTRPPREGSQGIPPSFVAFQKAFNEDRRTT